MRERRDADLPEQPAVLLPDFVWVLGGDRRHDQLPPGDAGGDFLQDHHLALLVLASADDHERTAARARWRGKHLSMQIGLAAGDLLCGGASPPCRRRRPLSVT